jgi:hypothetical protein
LALLLNGKEKKNMMPDEGDVIEKYGPKDDPSFFNIFIEKRHADQLQRRNLDEESRLEVIYRVLKD